MIHDLAVLSARVMNGFSDETSEGRDAGRPAKENAGRPASHKVLAIQDGSTAATRIFLRRRPFGLSGPSSLTAPGS